MKPTIYFAIAFVFSMSIFGCECEESHIEVFDPPEVFFVEDVFTSLAFIDSAYTVVIRFNKAVNPDAIVIGNSLTFEGFNPFIFSLEFLSDRVISIDGLYTNCAFDENQDQFCSIQISLKAAGQDAIQVISLDNQLLDGDLDGEDGGDFVYEDRFKIF